MFENYLSIVTNQYGAAFSTLNRCIEECSEELWDSKVAKLTFSQALFHTLFYADLYLHEINDESFKQQEFHERNQDSFRDYEEMQDKPQQHAYSKGFVRDYFQHCLDKSRCAFQDATEAWLLEPSPFPWIESTRSEVHIYNMRHIQHHAAQLILRLRLEGPIQFPWYRSGWEDCRKLG